MNIEEYNYNLPENLIAQTPLKTRSDSKLMIVDKKTGKLIHSKFNKIINYLESGDVLVLNDTKVIPARIIGIKEKTEAVVELLLLKNIEKDKWECLVKPQKRVKEGTILRFNDILFAKCIKVVGEGISVFDFTYEGFFYEILDRLGTMPLPPYIHETLKEQNRYQTVYATHLGSSAAPTAGLHFTNDILKELKNKGVIVTYVTLHVGLGTFLPVKEEKIKNHKMHTEEYIMSRETADILNRAKDDKRRIIAVGTTSLRTLETVYSKHKKFICEKGNTNIFIYPPYRIKSIDGIITNFHLPKSTLLLLVSAFSNKKIIMEAYNKAIKKEYRFFSFGDAMFITKDVYNKNKYKKLVKNFNKEKPIIRKHDFKIYKGNNNIIISVPHCFKHYRKNSIKDNELNTSKIAKILYKLTGVHIIYINKNCETDYNLAGDNLYKNTLKKYIKENKIEYLIDLHGMVNKKYDIIIGTNNGININNDIDLLNKIKSIIKINTNINLGIDEMFKSNTNTICTNVNNELNIKTFQFEIDKNYRMCKKMPIKFNKLIKTLIILINEMKG